jgi:hypothetical protein
MIRNTKHLKMKVNRMTISAGRSRVVAAAIFLDESTGGGSGRLPNREFTRWA